MHFYYPYILWFHWLFHGQLILLKSIYDPFLVQHQKQHIQYSGKVKLVREFP